MADSGSKDEGVIKGKARHKWREQAWLLACVAAVNLLLGLNIRNDLAGALPWPAALPAASFVAAAVCGVYGWVCWQRSRFQP